MKNRVRSFLAVVLTLSMLLSLSVPAWASSPIGGKGTSDDQFKVSTTSDITAYSLGGGKYALSYDNNTGSFSSSFITATGGSQSGSSVTYTGLTATGLVVGADEYVVLSADLPTEIRGNGVLTYNVDGSSPTITGADSSGAGKPLNTLLVASGRTARVAGSFKTVEGKVQPADDVVLGGSGYLVTGDADDSHKVTINGTAKASGTFTELTLNEGASVEITADTEVTNKITFSEDSTLTVRQDVTLCVNGVSVKPTANTTIRSWGTLPEGSYSAVSGSWKLGGNATVSSTECAIAGHGTNEDTLIADLNGKTLTIQDGAVKADGGTVIGEGGKAALFVKDDDVVASGAFDTISFETGKTMTVLKDQTISASFKDTDETVYTNSVTVLQDTVFSAFNGVLPTNSSGDPYKFTDLSGKWSNSDTVDGSETYVGKNATLTVTSDDMVISGTFAKLDTGDHSVKLGGGTEIADGTYTITGDTPYDLTVNGGTADLSGTFRDVTVNGGDVSVNGTLRTLTVNKGTVEDTGTLTIDNTGTTETYIGIRVNGGELLLDDEPMVKINGGASSPAVYVTGGELTMLNGTVEAWGNSIRAVEATSGGIVVFGEETPQDASGEINVPTLICHDSGSVGLFVNNGSKAWVYNAEIRFNDENSDGIRVNDGGEVYLYANDKFSESNLDLDKPLIHVSGTHGARSAVWVNNGGLLEVRGRGILLEAPERNDNGGYALYLHSDAKPGCVLSGGTYNGDVFYQTNETANILTILPVNHYLRFDGAAPNFAASDGSLGILPKGTYTDGDRYGSFVGNYDENNAFSETYLDRFGALGSYYSIVDAEWELRDRMARNNSYQLPAGLLDGNGAYTDTLTLDAGNAADWGIAKMQGDLNVSTNATLYLAGKTLTYDGASLDGVDSENKALRTDTDKDSFQTVAVTGSLTVIDAVIGGEGTNQSGDKFGGAYIGTGTIRYTGADNGETSAIHVCTGSLNVTSGKLVNANAANGSGVYLHGGTASFGTANVPNEDESNDNGIILVNGMKQALKLSADNVTANVYGGALKATGSAAVYGAYLEKGTLNVRGGVISGNNAGQGSGVFAKSGTANITGGALYGIYLDDSSQNGTSLCVDGATVNLQIDEAHSAYLTTATGETAGAHHISNINVKSGTLSIGTHGATDNFLRNNGTLVLEGGKTYYFDGVTLGDTTVYGAEVSGSAQGFGTEFYVEKGDFGALAVNNHNGDASPTYSYAHSGSGSLRDRVQLHGGYFSSIEVLVNTDDGAATAQDVIGVWVNKDHDAADGSEWARYNHYAEEVTSERAASGTWSKADALQSGTLQTAEVQTITAANGKAIAIRNAMNEFVAWAAGETEQPYLLGANLWLGEGNQCSLAYCDAAYAPVTVTNGAHTLDTNGFGIFGSTTDALLTIDKGGSLTVNKGSSDAGETYADRIRNLSSGAALDVTADGALTLGGAALASNGGIALTTAGETTVSSGSVSGGFGSGIELTDGTLSVADGTISGTTSGVEQSGGELSVSGGTITGATYGVEQKGGALSASGGTFTGSVCGLYRTAAEEDNKNSITGGTFSAIQTTVADEKLSDLLGKDNTLSDAGGVELGTDVLGRAQITDGDKSGDSATGGDSVKWEEETLTIVDTNATVSAPFTVAERSVAEVTLTSSDSNSTITFTNPVKAAADDTSISNETKTLYIGKDGGSVKAVITPAAGFCTGVVTRNGLKVADLSHKIVAQNAALTAQDTALIAEALAFHIDETYESGITSTVSGNTYTVSGKNLAKPIIKKINAEGESILAEEINVVPAVGGSFTVQFPEPLDSDYEIIGRYIRGGTGGGGGAAAPETTVSMSGDQNSVSLSATVNGSTATMAEPGDKELDRVVGEGVRTGEVVIDMSGLNSSVTAASIPARTVSAVAQAISDTANDANALTVVLPNAGVTLDAAAVGASTKQTRNTDLTVSVEEVAPNTLSATQRDALNELDTQKVIAVTVKSGSNVVSSFGGGHAEVTVPYELSAEQPEHTLVVRQLAANGSLTKVPATYRDGQLSFTADGSGNFVVTYEAEQTTVCPKDDTCPMAAFSDLKLDNWYHDGVHWALDSGVMNGQDNGFFAPDNDLTRAMIATMLWRMEGDPVSYGMNQFQDVDSDTWYGKAVIWANEVGIINGFDDPDGAGRLFGPDQSATREQLAAMLYRYAQYKGLDVSVGEDTNILSYEDAMSVSPWAMSAMQWACGAGVISGVATDGTMVLLPQTTATRAVVATMLERFCNDTAQ